MVLPPTADPSRREYTELDDAVVAPEYEDYTIVKWGERPFSDPDHYVGYNCDYTAYIPVHGILDGVLWVNHEYASFPFSTLSPGTPSSLPSAPASPSSSELFNAGTLFVARFNPDGTGVWVPLLLSTPTNPLTPSQIAAEELAALGSAQQNGRIRLPRRNGVAGQRPTAASSTST